MIRLRFSAVQHQRNTPTQHPDAVEDSNPLVRFGGVPLAPNEPQREPAHADLANNKNIVSTIIVASHHTGKKRPFFLLYPGARILEPAVIKGTNPAN